DNKELRKQVQNIIAEIENDLNMKKAGFNVCMEGFDPEKFLQARAVALLKEEKPGRKEDKDNSYLSVNPELYKELIRWRSIKARQMGLPAYRIIRQPVLAEISVNLPVTIAQLKKVKKIGAKKTMQFGPDIVKIVSEYMKKMGLEIIADDCKTDLNIKKHTSYISLEMFRSGMSIEKIAKERGYVVSTIEGHLAKCIADGDLLVDEVLDVNKIAVITEYFLSVDSYGLSHAREVLGEEYSYAEIRFVLTQLIREGKITPN
ncbi:MAG: helix-turn-helix domain-containing protein, partial [Bacteroidota bacterium]